MCLLFVLIVSFWGCTETVQKENVEKQIRSVFYIDGELPDIGHFSGSKNQEHFHGRYTPDFITCDSYGEIIPYIGNYKIYKTGDADWLAEQGYASYGFCTSDGKIVMDASEKNSHVNYFETDDGFGYYTVTRNIKQREDAPDEYYASETLLIPRSGKWCKVLKTGSWVCGAGNGALGVCVYENDKPPKLVLYDYDGNELLSLDDVDTATVQPNGIILIRKWTNNTSEQYFVNAEGERLLGSYKYAANFNDSGITYVSDYNDDYYFIDTKGNRITHESYSGITECIKDGVEIYYIARHKQYPYRGNDIIDKNGNVIANIENSSYLSLRFPKNGEIIYRADGGVWRKLSDRSEFKSREFGVSPSEFYGTDDLYIYKNEEDGSGILFDGNGETVGVFESFCEALDISENGKYLVYNSGAYDYKYDEALGKGIIIDTRKLHIYDTDKKENIYSFDLAGYGSYIGDDDRYIMIYTYQSDYFAGGTSLYLFDTKTNRMIFENCKTIIHNSIEGKNYFNVCTANSCTLYDSDMNVIIRTYTE